MSNPMELVCKLTGHLWERNPKEDTNNRMCFVCKRCGAKQNVKKPGCR